MSGSKPPMPKRENFRSLKRTSGDRHDERREDSDERLVLIMTWSNVTGDPVCVAAIHREQLSDYLTLLATDVHVEAGRQFWVSENHPLLLQTLTNVSSDDSSILTDDAVGR